MKKLLALGVFFLLFACGEPAEEGNSSDSAQADEENPVDIGSDPIALLNAATEAVLNVDAVSYNIALEGFFVDTDTTEISVDGEASLRKGATLDEACVFVNYSLTMGEEVVEGMVASNGSSAFFVDPVSEEFHHGLIEMGASRLVQNAPQGTIMVEYLIPDEPFGAELLAQGYSFLDQETLNGVLCHVLEVQMPPYTSTWWIDAESYLPRANQISVWGPDGTGMEYTIVLTDLVVDGEQPDSSRFQLQCPDGYSSTEYVGAVAIGAPAPLWTLETPEGRVISLEELRGKVVIMDFWATWCGPCRQVMPSLQELHDSYGEELVVLGVNTWEQEDPAAFMLENGYTYPIVINGDAVAQQYFVEGIPTFYVIAQDGTVAFHAVGADPANEEALEQILGTLLAE